VYCSIFIFKERYALAKEEDQLHDIQASSSTFGDYARRFGYSQLDIAGVAVSLEGCAQQRSSFQIHCV
jgi:hypothetical protein